MPRPRTTHRTKLSRRHRRRQLNRTRTSLQPSLHTPKNRILHLPATTNEPRTRLPSRQVLILKIYNLIPQQITRHLSSNIILNTGHPPILTTQSRPRSLITVRPLHLTSKLPLKPPHAVAHTDMNINERPITQSQGRLQPHVHAHNRARLELILTRHILTITTQEHGHENMIAIRTTNQSRVRNLGIRWNL